MLWRKRWVYSPIVHCHQLAKLFDLPFDANFWHNYNFAMLERAGDFALLKLPGWNASIGVADEIEEAKRLDLPVELIIP